MSRRDDGKTPIRIGGRPVGMPVTESQAVLILRWLDSDGVMEALSNLRPVERETRRLRECEHYCAGQVIGDGPDAACMCGALTWADA